MNFLQISLTCNCNYACLHCPMKEWRNSVPPKFPLTNKELIDFLERYVDPLDWVVELTGGEPTLYVGFDELLKWLSSFGYYTLVKTNGSNPIHKYHNVKICSAFHNLDCPPVCYDEILIVDKIDRVAKETYCMERGIPYKVIGFNKENPDGATHGFTYISYINGAGHNCSCPAKSPIQLENDEGSYDYGRIVDTPLQKSYCCKRCKAAIDAWRFLPDFIKEIA